MTGSQGGPWALSGKILEVDGGIERPNLDLALPDL